MPGVQSATGNSSDIERSVHGTSGYTKNGRNGERFHSDNGAPSARESQQGNEPCPDIKGRTKTLPCSRPQKALHFEKRNGVNGTTPGKKNQKGVPSLSFTKSSGEAGEGNLKESIIVSLARQRSEGK